jgi:hypothetical protein
LKQLDRGSQVNVRFAGASFHFDREITEVLASGAYFNSGISRDDVDLLTDSVGSCSRLNLFGVSKKVGIIDTPLIPKNSVRNGEKRVVISQFERVYFLGKASIPAIKDRGYRVNRLELVILPRLELDVHCHR